MFGEVNESVRAYGIGGHRHVAEIEQELADIAVRAGLDVSANPGIVGGRLPPPPHPDDARHPVGLPRASDARRSARPSSTGCTRRPTPTSRSSRCRRRRRRPSDVTGSNHVQVHVSFDERTGRILAIGVEDNLVKGAAGQAIQAFNIVHGLPETAGLEQLPLAP